MSREDPDTAKSVQRTTRQWLRLKDPTAPIKGKKVPWYMRGPRGRPPAGFLLIGVTMKDYANMLLVFLGILRLPFTIIQCFIEELRARKAVRQKHKEDDV